jgi:hypothetical protein
VREKETQAVYVSVGVSGRLHMSACEGGGGVKVPAVWPQMRCKVYRTRRNLMIYGSRLERYCHPF